MKILSGRLANILPSLVVIAVGLAALIGGMWLLHRFPFHGVDLYAKAAMIAIATFGLLFIGVRNLLAGGDSGRDSDPQ